MTLIEALKKAYEMWSWLAEHPLKDKKAYTEEVGLPFDYRNYDPLCEYFKCNCEQCVKVVLWPDMKACDCRLVGKWLDQVERAKSTLSLFDIKASAETAAKIRDIIKEALNREIKNHREIYRIKNNYLDMCIIQEGEKVEIEIYYQDERFRRMNDKDACKEYMAQNGMKIQSVNGPEIRRDELFLMGDYNRNRSMSYCFDSFQEASDWVSRCMEAVEDWARNCDAFHESQNIPTDLEDKQLCWCWDEEDICTRTIGFYDAVNECVFAYDGQRSGISLDYYEPYKGEWSEWAKEAYLELKGCKSSHSEKLYYKIKAVDKEAAEEFLKEVAKAELDKEYARKINYNPDAESIVEVFLWHTTSQGRDFWDDVHDKLIQRRED